MCFRPLPYDDSDTLETMAADAHAVAMLGPRPPALPMPRRGRRDEQPVDVPADMAAVGARHTAD